MGQALRRFLDPLVTMNRRVSIGGGVLALLLLYDSTAALIAPMT